MIYLPVEACTLCGYSVADGEDGIFATVYGQVCVMHFDCPGSVGYCPVCGNELNSFGECEVEVYGDGHANINSVE